MRKSTRSRKCVDTTFPMVDYNQFDKYVPYAPAEFSKAQPADQGKPKSCKTSILAKCVDFNNSFNFFYSNQFQNWHHWHLDLAEIGRPGQRRGRKPKNQSSSTVQRNESLWHNKPISKPSLLQIKTKEVEVSKQKGGCKNKRKRNSSKTPTTHEIKKDLDMISQITKVSNEKLLNVRNCEKIETISDDDVSREYSYYFRSRL